MEKEWVPAMQTLLDIPTASLPALWDADFLYGPKTEDGSDIYVLCEINASSVAPYPDSPGQKSPQQCWPGSVLRSTRANSLPGAGVEEEPLKVGTLRS